jgi:hypothetical protein
VKIATDAFTQFPEPPTTTNHGAQYGDLKGLWHAALSDKVLERAQRQRNCGDWNWVESKSHHRDKRGGFMPHVVPAQRLLRHLRWASLGPRYGGLPSFLRAP